MKLNPLIKFLHFSVCQSDFYMNRLGKVESRNREKDLLLIIIRHHVSYFDIYFSLTFYYLYANSRLAI